MDPEQPIYIFPRADNTTLLLAAALFMALLVGAFLLEAWRRRREKRLRLAAEWRAIDTLMADKELTPREQKLFREVLERHAPMRPFHGATMRHEFDSLVDGEMNRIAASGDQNQFEERGIALRDIRMRLGLDYVPFGQRIHTTRDLHPGQPVWVNAGNAEDKKSWSSMIVTVVDEARFVLAPKEGGILPSIKPGHSVRCRMWREEDARYLFEAPLLRRETGPEALVFLHTAELDRTQSRAHFRIRHDQTAEVSVITSPVDKDESKVVERPAVARLRGRITSLSGGGLAVVISQPVPKDVYLKLQLDLDPTAEALSATVRLVESAALPGGRYLLRGSFVLMDDETRDIITHFVFKQQTASSAPTAPTSQANA